MSGHAVFGKWEGFAKITRSGPPAKSVGSLWSVTLFKVCLNRKVAGTNNMVSFAVMVLSH